MDVKESVLFASLARARAYDSAVFHSGHARSMLLCSPLTCDVVCCEVLATWATETRGPEKLEAQKTGLWASEQGGGGISRDFLRLRRRPDKNKKNAETKADGRRKLPRVSNGI